MRLDPRDVATVLNILQGQLLRAAKSGARVNMEYTLKDVAKSLRDLELSLRDVEPVSAPQALPLPNIAGMGLSATGKPIRKEEV